MSSSQNQNQFSKQYKHHCFPVGTCIFCGVQPAQLPSVGYCTTCQKAGIPSSPGTKFTKCIMCDRYHAASAVVLTIHD